MIEIIDKNFKKHIEKLFNKPIDNVTQNDFNSIIKLKLYCLDIISLQGVENFTNLKYLDCSWNNLKRLDISKNKKLEYLGCGKNLLTKLNISKNINLNWVDCSYNQLIKLDISENKNLKILFCNNNLLQILVFSKNIELDELYNCRNQLKKSDISKNKKFTRFYISVIEKNYMDLVITILQVIEKFKILKFLNCFFNQLDESKNINLYYLDCTYNKLEKLYISKNIYLKNLDCDANTKIIR